MEIHSETDSARDGEFSSGIKSEGDEDKDMVGVGPASSLGALGAIGGGKPSYLGLGSSSGGIGGSVGNSPMNQMRLLQQQGSADRIDRVAKNKHVTMTTNVTSSNSNAQQHHPHHHHHHPHSHHLRGRLNHDDDDDDDEEEEDEPPPPSSYPHATNSSGGIGGPGGVGGGGDSDLGNGTAGKCFDCHFSGHTSQAHRANYFIC